MKKLMNCSAHDIIYGFIMSILTVTMIIIPGMYLIECGYHMLGVGWVAVVGLYLIVVFYLMSAEEE